ncbi:MAG: hypothetical protein ABFE08_09005 [Armatimonadia bacterium]
MTFDFDQDLATGTKTLFHADEENDSFVIETQQDITAILEDNQIELNEVTSLDRFGEGKRVASIPLSIYCDLQKKGIVEDQAAMRRWLNDPVNKVFRTFRGKL